jgi:plastocyanin
MKVRTLVGAGTLLGTIAAVAACNSSLYGSGGGSCSPTATQVCMVSSTFSPSNRTVTAGTTVQWVNGDGITHTVTSDTTAEVYNTSVGGGGTFSHQFNTAGTYPYHCTIHGAKGTGMHGTITVN